jgi:DNA polymerase elongation subunit (family B)
MRVTFTGGYVYEPTAGIFKDIAVVDFRSLYPTIIVSYNIGPSTIGKKGIKVTVDGRTHEFGQKRKRLHPASSQ